MRKTLTKKSHKKLLGMHRSLEKEIRWRSRFGYERAMEILEAMHELLTLRGSWEKQR